MNELNICNLRLADFAYAFNKTRQRFSDVILEEGDGPAVIPALAKKITSELAEVSKSEHAETRSELRLAAHVTLRMSTRV